MGKAGQPVDHAAWDAKRQRALYLLERGYSMAVIARSVGASKSWVQRIAQEHKAPNGRAASA
jgi:SOS response regulatory protein OraA/RecX